MDDVAIYIAFAGVLGTTCDRGVRGDAVDASDVTEDGLFDACAATLPTPSETALASGGGNGEMEMLEIEAEWAW